MEKNLFKATCIVLLLAGCASKEPAPVQAEKPKNPMAYSDVKKNAVPDTPTPLLPPTGEKALTPSPLIVVPTIAPNAPIPVEPVQDESNVRGVPRIGLIFSAGGAKAWGHIGVLKEIEKAKWPIKASAGIEWGAAVAAVYGHQLSANETEWELSKVKSFEDLEQSSETLFANKSVNDLKVPFVCPSLNIAKQEIYLLNRGQLAKLMPFCLAHPPLSEVYKQSVAVLDAVDILAQHLRATGIKKVVLINVLFQKEKQNLAGSLGTGENILWAKAAAELSNKPKGVDDVIQINLDDYGIKEIDKRREIIAKAAELSYDQVRKLSKKYGL